MGRVTDDPGGVELDLSTIGNISTFRLVYHEDEDALFLRPEKPRPATSYDWDGEIWLRVDPTNGEIVGLEIDDFEAVFVKKHPEIGVAWHQAKPLCRRKRPSARDRSGWDSFVRMILDLLTNILRDPPKQGRLRLAPI
jgi:uncharacterized protein YuzE